MNFILLLGNQNLTFLPDLLGFSEKGNLKNSQMICRPQELHAAFPAFPVYPETGNLAILANSLAPLQ